MSRLPTYSEWIDSIGKEIRAQCDKIRYPPPQGYVLTTDEDGDTCWQEPKPEPGYHPQRLPGDKDGLTQGWYYRLDDKYLNVEFHKYPTCSWPPIIEELSNRYRRVDYPYPAFKRPEAMQWFWWRGRRMLYIFEHELLLYTMGWLMTRDNSLADRFLSERVQDTTLSEEQRDRAATLLHLIRGIPKPE